MGKILVTGGLGYIGSHTVVELQKAGYQVLIADSLVNSDIKVLDSITAITGKKPYFHQADLSKKREVEDLFSRHPNIDGAIHFAAFKAVGESVTNPLAYYRNNLCTIIFMLEEFQKRHLKYFIFSSSCTVYGDSVQQPLSESSPRQAAASPYGNTKMIAEDILIDLCKVYDLQAIALRYFNPIGAHESGLIGEIPNGIPQNLVPYLTQTALGIHDELKVWGNDYPTRDGTCIRDYIHVSDLAEAHVIALKRLISGKNSETLEFFNIGTGEGSTVMEVIKTFEEATGQIVPYKIEARRPGDVVVAYADTQKAQNELGWKAQHTLAQALASAYEWEKKVTEQEEG